MQISELAFRLLLLFLPGLLCAYVIDELTIHRPRELAFFLLKSFVLGMGCYFTYWAVIKGVHLLWPGAPLSELIFLRALVDSKVTFSFAEIAYVSILAVVVGCLVSFSAKHKLVNRLAQWSRVTKKFGELDVWGYMLNIPDIVWVTVRDHKNNLVYDGWIQAFSDDSKNAELLLRDVSIYKNDTGERLYQSGAVYLSRDRGDISIECRTLPLPETVKWKEEQNEGDTKATATPVADDSHRQRGPNEKGWSKREADHSPSTTSEGPGREPRREEVGPRDGRGGETANREDDTNERFKTDTKTAPAEA
jgi:hypothetical protein